MKLMKGVFKLLTWLIQSLIRLVLAASLIVIAGLGGYIYHKGSQPMDVLRATPPLPPGITYWQFMEDRIDAAQIVDPQRCGISAIAFFLAIAPVYSVIYSIGGMRPESIMGRAFQPDASIPYWAAGLSWGEAPNVWWWVVENISWAMLARQGLGCNLRAVMIK
jgi:hypothetical protein